MVLMETLKMVLKFVRSDAFVPFERHLALVVAALFTDFIGTEQSVATIVSEFTKYTLPNPQSVGLVLLQVFVCYLLIFCNKKINVNVRYLQ